MSLHHFWISVRNLAVNDDFPFPIYRSKWALQESVIVTLMIMPKAC